MILAMAGYVGFMGCKFFCSKKSWEHGDVFHFYDLPMLGVFACVSSEHFLLHINVSRWYSPFAFDRVQHIAGCMLAACIHAVSVCTH
jgi:hypothetical protein